MSAAVDRFFEPTPLYPSGHYDKKKVGALHKGFKPPVRHLVAVDEFEDVDSIEERERIAFLKEAALRIKEVHLQQCRDDFACFLEYCYVDPVSGKGFELQWYHEEWIQAMEENRRIIIIAPRGHGKTSIILPYIVWRLGRNPNLRVKIVCADDPTAIKRLETIKKTIEKNQKVREVFPHLRPDKKTGWAMHSIFVQREIIDPEPSLEGKGIGSSITGARCDLLLADDIVSLQNAIIKPGHRQKVIGSWENDWMNLVHDDSQIIYICTLYHRDDNSHKVMRSGAYKKLFYQIKGGNGFGSMWPDKISEASLRDKRTTMSPSAWARGYKNEPIADIDRLIQEAWVKYDIFDIRSMMEEGWVFFTSYDVATGLKEANDFFASTTGAVNPISKKVRVVDAWRAKLTKAQQALMIYKEYQRYKPFRVLVEIAGNESLDQRVLEDYPELLGILEPVTPRGSKYQRLDGVTPFLENDHVRFAAHLDADNEKFDERRGNLVYELVEFPADHDDMADSFSQLLDGIRRYYLDQYQWKKDNQEVEVIVF